jgi:hypothetical protein
MKLRKPDSLEDACTQAKALLGADGIATALSAINLRCSTSLIDKWCDADSPQVPSFPQVMAVETLLIKTGNEPIFVELLQRLQSAAAEELTGKTDPLREAMRACGHAAKVMETVDRSMVDDTIDKTELGEIDRGIVACRKQLARVSRVVRWKMTQPKQAARRS